MRYNIYIIYMVNNRTRSRRGGSIKKEQGLKVVDINSVLDCKNKKYGCDLKAKRFTCYTHTKYKQFIDNCFSLLPGQALHAKTLGFVHPITDEPLFFNTDLPKGFQELIAKWENYTATLKDS